MKIVQSFWSKPSFSEEQNYYNSRKTGGWLNFKYFLLSSCFSCLTAKRHYDQVHLYTDQTGKKLFVDLLNLPYNEVFLDLDELNDSNHKLWVLAKFKVFKAQREPFIHIDNDVYLWEKLFPLKEHGPLFAQSSIRILPGYKPLLKYIFDNFDFIPDCMLSQKVTSRTVECNTGIIGGTNMDFFQEYCQIAHEFIERNSAAISNMDAGTLNTVVEQYLFTCLARHRKLKVKYVISVPHENEFSALVRLNLVPIIDKYIHLIGYAKQKAVACEQLELRLRYEFPDFYDKVIKTINNVYPDLASENYPDAEKTETQLKNISHLYTNTIEQLQSKKIRLSGNVFLSEFSDPASGVSDITLTIQKKNTDHEQKKLSGQDVILAYFTTPVSVNDIVDSIRQNYPSDEKNLEDQRLKLVDFVTKKMIFDGVLEFG